MKANKIHFIAEKDFGSDKDFSRGKSRPAG